MAFPHLASTFSQGTFLSLLLLAICYVHWDLTKGAARRALIKAHGCKSIKHGLVYTSFPNNIIGFKALWENMAGAKAHKFHEVVRQRFLRYGNTIQLNILTDAVITTMEPENIKTILSLNFSHWSLGPQRQSTFIPLLGEGIFTTDGAAWKHSRELLRPNFVRAQVADLDRLESHILALIDAIPKDGSTVNLQDLFFQLTMDFATEFLFGESTNCLGSSTSDGVGARFAQAFNRSQKLLAASFRTGILGRLTVHYSRTFKKDAKCCHDFVDRYVQQGLQYRKSPELREAGAVPDTEGRYIFLNELSKQTSDPIAIRSELLNILVAGRDTTASLISIVWFILARRPDIWEKLRAAVNKLEGQKPTFQDLKGMDYMRWILNETLRLYPAVPGNLRTAVVDTVLPLGGGDDGKDPIFIKAGQPVSWNLWSMHRRTDFYGEDAEDFKPERWATLKPGWEYLPFNGGPRICLGQQFALTEASYVTIRLMQAFKQIESRDDQPWQEKLALTCSIRQGTLVGLTPM